jgi:hypothetical protein
MLAGQLQARAIESWYSEMPLDGVMYTRYQFKKLPSKSTIINASPALLSSNPVPMMVYPSTDNTPPTPTYMNHTSLTPLCESTAPCYLSSYILRPGLVLILLLPLISASSLRRLSCSLLSVPSRWLRLGLPRFITLSLGGSLRILSLRVLGNVANVPAPFLGRPEGAVPLRYPLLPLVCPCSMLAGRDIDILGLLAFGGGIVELIGVDAFDSISLLSRNLNRFWLVAVKRTGGRPPGVSVSKLRVERKLARPSSGDGSLAFGG